MHGRQRVVTQDEQLSQERDNEHEPGPCPSCAACGFESSAEPGSVAYHVGHRDAHLAKFPDSNAETRTALDRMVSLAKRGAFSAPKPPTVTMPPIRVGSLPDLTDMQTALTQMGAIVNAAHAACGDNVYAMIPALVGAIGVIAAQTTRFDELMKLAIHSLEHSARETQKHFQRSGAPS